MEYYYGIDFGTTNSAMVSLSSTGKLATYGDSEGQPYPSFVAINNRTGEVIKGRKAWNQRYELEDYCHIFRSIKTSLNNKHESRNIAGRTWTPEDVVTEILKGLQEKVSSEGHSVDKAVIAIPVGFDATSRKVVRRAAERAGIAVDSFISESTSAFFNYQEDLRHYRKIAVFDWGGGTLDISLLMIEGDHVSEVAINSDSFAGDAIDFKLANYIHRELARKEETEDILFDHMPPLAKDSLMLRCEKAKVNLSAQSDTIMQFIYDVFGPVNYTLSRSVYEDIIQPDIQRIIDKLLATIKSARWSKEEIDKIVLVGGSCNVPLLREMIEDVFGEKVYHASKPEWSIAKGAARLAKDPGSYVSSHDFGVVLSDNSFFSLIEKGERINDLKKQFVFGLVEDSPDARLIFAERFNGDFEGKRSARDDFNMIGEYMSIPCFGFTFEPVEINLASNKDLIISIAAKSRNRDDQHTVKRSFEKAIKLKYRLPNYE